MCVKRVGCYSWDRNIWQRTDEKLEKGKKVFTDIKSIIIIFKISDHYCISLHWKGVDINVLFCKRAKLQHYNDVYKIWAHGL